MAAANLAGHPIWIVTFIAVQIAVTLVLVGIYSRKDVGDRLTN